MKLRPATDEDIEQLVHFNASLALETERKVLDLAVLAKGVKGLLDDSSRGFYLVAEVESEIVGSLMVTTEWSDWRNGEYWWIQSVYVSPTFRRKGVFRALLEDIRALAMTAENVCGFRLYVERDNQIAQATYNSLGFCATDYKMLEDSWS